MDVYRELANLKNEISEVKETMFTMQRRIDELEGVPQDKVQAQNYPQPKKSILKAKYENSAREEKKEKKKKKKKKKARTATKSLRHYCSNPRIINFFEIFI